MCDFLQGLLLEIELLDWFNLTHYNYESLEAEKESALMDRKEALAAKDVAENKVQELEERLRRQGEELERVLQERLKVRELKLARRKWEEEAMRLRDLYKTLDGLINAKTDKAVITSFFKDEWCYRLFSRVATPVASDTLAIFRDHIQQTNPTFELSEQFQSLAVVSQGNVYL